MKFNASLRLLLASGACATTVGCHKSVDQRFDEMYQYQLKHDHESATVTAGAYKFRAHLPNRVKEQMIDAYAEVRKAREQVGKDDAK